MGEAVAGDPIDVASYLGFVVPGGGADIMCFKGYNISYLIEFQGKGEFFYDLCVGGFCKADLTDDWILTNVSYPCDDNREGIFCGQCKPGFAVKPLTWVSDITQYTNQTAHAILENISCFDSSTAQLSYVYLFLSSSLVQTAVGPIQHG